ncbi:chemotaxis protein CheV [Arcobacter roscoffensis]|uniref:Response regulator n=1 Tax=Arcobacter roscoffensis TaxID=2961520 RepID=A0ABY5E443_9BACT|nr:response regulator [Arcobacter roscoffensis]UTJ05540.1 response regulator [Arcobacter roscoffensis]
MLSSLDKNKNGNKVLKNVIQQFAVFYTGDDSVYAINIAKVKAFIITSDVSINDTPSDSDVIAGIATIRGEPITLVNLDVWLGNKARDISEYKLIVYCEFSNKKVGLLVKDMVNIIEKATNELRYSEERTSKVTNTTYVDIEKEPILCTVFNAEQLLQDIGLEKNVTKEIQKYENVVLESKKKILVAEDSAIARSVIIDFLEKIKANYEIYNDGKSLINRVENINLDDVGVIISDIEMPGADGYEVASFIKQNSKYSNIPVIINSSMTTNAVKSRMAQIGVDSFVGKTDIDRLYTVIKNHLE